MEAGDETMHCVTSSRVNSLVIVLLAKIIHIQKGLTAALFECAKNGSHYVQTPVEIKVILD